MSTPATIACHDDHGVRAARVRLWGNFLGYQAVWFAAVMGAAHTLTWPGAVALAGFAAWQLGMSRRRRVECKLIVAAVCCGLVLDGSLAASGWINYAAPAVSVPPGGAPLWILALWASFAMTLTQSLRYLQKRLWVACLFGVIGGPLAYWCAARAWSVVVFAAPQWHALTALAVGWGVAMPLLAGAAKHWSAHIDTHSSGDTR